MSSVFVVNAGSSSLKYQLIDLDSGNALATGLVERIGETRAVAKHTDDISGETFNVERSILNHTDAVSWALAAFEQHGPSIADSGLIAVGHRVVQGGSRFDGPEVITPSVVSQIRDLSPLAPLHNPANLLGIEAAQIAFPDVPHVAVFDTAFHRSMPAASALYPIDRATAEANRIRRYGFHGTSHEYVSKRIAALEAKPLTETNSIVLHLGNGASACAVRGGASVDTSMGMTPLAGLMMGTRVGDIDAGIVFHLARVGGLSLDEIETLLNKRSGILGLAGLGDMRDVQASANAGVVQAKEALDVYVHRVRHYLGAYLVQLGRVDAIAFTAGVGENSDEIRRRVMLDLEGFGIEIDAARNSASERGERRISTDDSRIAVYVIPTNEELEIAQQAAAAAGI
ncbi:acetate/propionate family kinase [Humidisolicoccus flavus]|uniref:acetate/propionate family kinase n=1 Tax=Humidisolicoccus flavus TaxID=3111414 RepID=UPI00324D7638